MIRRLLASIRSAACPVKLQGETIASMQSSRNTRSAARAEASPAASTSPPVTIL